MALRVVLSWRERAKPLFPYIDQSLDVGPGMECDLGRGGCLQLSQLYRLRGI